MNKKELLEFIRNEIYKAAAEKLKHKNKHSDKESKTDVLTQEEVDKYLFFGGEEMKNDGDSYYTSKRKIFEQDTTLQPEYDKPKIAASEIKAEEDKFKQNVTALGEFDKDSQGKTAFKVFKTKNGRPEAQWSGRIPFENQDYLKWSFSIQDGMRIEGSYEVSEDNRDIVVKLFNFFISWKKDWIEKITKLPGV